ncbi:MAG: hypothetical protein KIS67_02335 [Verrucomicrobiae bacterium]|nr:hypothetical protein [Verrucomicrobiae bacterium]
MKRIISNRIALRAHSVAFVLLAPTISRQGNIRQGNDKRDFSRQDSSAVHSLAFIPLTNIPLSTSHA